MFYLFAVHTPDTPFVWVEVFEESEVSEAEEKMTQVVEEMPDAMVELFSVKLPVP